jgi:hypothetical protein
MCMRTRGLCGAWAGLGGGEILAVAAAEHRPLFGGVLHHPGRVGVRETLNGARMVYNATIPRRSGAHDRSVPSLCVANSLGAMLSSLHS